MSELLAGVGSFLGSRVAVMEHGPSFLQQVGCPGESRDVFDPFLGGCLPQDEVEFCDFESFPYS